MNKWHEILLAGSVVAAAILFLGLNEVEPLFGKIFAYLTYFLSGLG